MGSRVLTFTVLGSWFLVLGSGFGTLYASRRRMRIARFQDLFVWQIADELRREIIAFTDVEPAAKDFRFRSQVREAIASVCRNTSEGFDRFRPAEFAATSNSRADRWERSRTA